MDATIHLRTRMRPIVHTILPSSLASDLVTPQRSLPPAVSRLVGPQFGRHVTLESRYELATSQQYSVASRAQRLRGITCGLRLRRSYAGAGLLGGRRKSAQAYALRGLRRHGARPHLHPRRTHLPERHT